jgi:hypothetical protein
MDLLMKLNQYIGTTSAKPDESVPMVLRVDSIRTVGATIYGNAQVWLDSGSHVFVREPYADVLRSWLVGLTMLEQEKVALGLDASRWPSIRIPSGVPYLAFPHELMTVELDPEPATP